jgi:hypothetical protein
MPEKHQHIARGLSPDLVMVMTDKLSTTANFHRYDQPFLGPV